MAETSSTKTNKAAFCFRIGLFAGLIWGLVKIIEHALEFTTVVPGFLVEPFYKHPFLATWPGYLIGWGSFIAFSIAAAYGYMAMLGKAKGPGPGIAYGVGIWALLYLLAGPLLGLVPPINELTFNTLITDLCLFLLWGLFIGYSISFELTNDRTRATS